jgi:hypothetical protein
MIEMLQTLGWGIATGAIMGLVMGGVLTERTLLTQPPDRLLQIRELYLRNMEALFEKYGRGSRVRYTVGIVGT